MVVWGVKIMSPQDTGTKFENYLVNLFNNKKFSELNNQGQYVIKNIFDKYDDNAVFESGLVRGFMKPDIYIKHGDKTVHISVKTGTARTVHQERISTFIPFLRRLGISNRTLQTILFMHFSDGTMDGTGEKRYSFEDMRYHLKDRIIEANRELNSRIEIVQAFIEHCMFVGVITNAIPADYIYHGEENFGYLVSKEDFIKYIKRKNWSYLSNLHIGPVYFRCHARYLNKPILSEKSRLMVDVWFPNLITHVRNASVYASTRNKKMETR